MRLAALLLLFLPALAGAHAALEVRIAALTEQIKERPAEAALYWKRGELRRVHRDWDAALADFERALQLDPTLAEVVLSRGRALHEAGRSAEALADLKRYRTLRPADREGMLVRARALAAAGRYAEAAHEYDSAIAASKTPTPEYYLERAQAWVKASRAERALAGLNEGVAALGPLVTLQSSAIDLETAQGNSQAALARLETIRPWTPAERYHLRRGEILEAAGRVEAAEAEFELALAAVEARAASGRNTAGAIELAADLRARLRR